MYPKKAHNVKKNKLIDWLLSSVLLATVFLPIPGISLESDRSKIMRIRANSVTINDKSGVSKYSGRVVIVQGSMKITADRLKVIYDKNKKLEKIIAFGRPSTYKQRPSIRKKEVYARANRMDYFAKTNELLMKKNASFTQGVSVFEGHKIRYNIKTDYVEASSSKSSRQKSGSDSKGRVNIIFDSATDKIQKDKKNEKK